MLITTLSFSQVEKVDTHEPLRINTIINSNNQRIVASSEIYNDKATIYFFDKDNLKVITLDIGINDFKKVYLILSDYEVEENDLYTVNLNSGKLFIRFSDIRGYKQSHLYVEMDDHILFLPKLNRLQYKKLFQE